VAETVKEEDDWIFRRQAVSEGACSNTGNDDHQVDRQHELYS